MKKYYMAVLLSAALLLTACGGKFATVMPEGEDPKVPAESDAVEANTDNDTPKKPFEPEGRDNEAKSPDSVDTNVPQGITVNRINFEVLSDGVPADLEALIEANKANQGFAAMEIGSEWYVVVFMGEQLTGGFAVEVNSVEDNEGKTCIFVNEVRPADDAILMMALTYPYQVIKITDGIAPNFNVVNQDGLEYPEAQ